MLTGGGRRWRRGGRRGRGRRHGRRRGRGGPGRRGRAWPGARSPRRPRPNPSCPSRRTRRPPRSPARPPASVPGTEPGGSRALSVPGTVARWPTESVPNRRPTVLGGCGTRRILVEGCRSVWSWPANPSNRSNPGIPASRRLAELRGPRSASCSPNGRSSSSRSAPSSSTAPTCRSTPTSSSPTEVAEAAVRRARRRPRRLAAAAPRLQQVERARLVGGHVWLSASTLLAVLDDIGRCAAMTPARRLVFLNGHGGNSALLSVALPRPPPPLRPAHVPRPSERPARPGRQRRRPRSWAWASTAAPTRRRSCSTSGPSCVALRRRAAERPRGRWPPTATCASAARSCSAGSRTTSAPAATSATRRRPPPSWGKLLFEGAVQGFGEALAEIAAFELPT